MKAIVYDFTIPKYVAAKALGKRFPSLYYGKPSALSLKEVSEPKLPNENWVKIKPIYSGLCGSDMGAVFYKTSPVLTPFNSFPSVMGHEVVGYVTEVGANVTRVQVGQRVTIDPYINCDVRGVEERCPACQKGLQSLCRNKSGTETFGAGMILGFCSELPGTWGEAFLAHDSMIIPVPDIIQDKVAALFEPLSVGLHAVLRQVPEDGEHVLVIGGGMIAYAVIAAIRMLDINCTITQLSLLEYQKKAGLKLGVDHGVTNMKDLTKVMLNIPNTTSHKPMIGNQVFAGGFDAVYDCVGSKESLEQSLDMVRERGKVTLVGCAGEIKNLDWTFIWANELSILGTHAYSKKEVWKGEEISTHELLMNLLVKHPNYPIDQLVTHEFTLDEYQEAILANMEREKHESVKVLFRV